MFVPHKHALIVNSGMDMYALDRKGKTAISYAIGQLGKDAKGGVLDGPLHILLIAYFMRGFDIFSRPNGRASLSVWEQLCGTGRINEPLLRLLRQHLKGRLNLELLQQGKEIMKQWNVTFTEEIGEALAKIA